jgi:hypothetical protein
MLQLSETKRPAVAPKASRQGRRNIVETIAPPAIVTSVPAPHPIYGKIPIGRDGFTLERQMLETLNLWHEKAFNLHINTTDENPEHALAALVENEIYEIAMQATPEYKRAAICQLEILARHAFRHGSVSVIGVCEFLLLIERLKKISAPAVPKKPLGKLQRGRKLTRAGLLVRYESFLAHELETISWHLYGDKNVSFGRVMFDRAITVRCAPNRRSDPFLGETKLPVRARSVLKSLKIDTERNDEVSARSPGG